MLVVSDRTVYDTPGSGSRGKSVKTAVIRTRWTYDDARRNATLAVIVFVKAVMSVVPKAFFVGKFSL